jgi:predicted lipoprotein with Yx(FWY)xxD motif
VSLKPVKGIEDPTLVGPDGKTVYLFEADKNGKPTCAGACTKFWPPVTVSSMPSTGSGLDKSLLGTVKRADGSTQVTYAGHPLYYYSGDAGPGTALGQAMSAFGAECTCSTPRAARSTRASDGWAPGRWPPVPRRHSRLTAVSTAAATSSPGG